MAHRESVRTRLAAECAGDAELIARVRQLVGSRRRDRISVGLLRNGQWRTARFGAADDLRYEIGSVTKTFTGSLLAVALARGEVTVDTTAGELLTLEESPAAALHLEDIATHHSGLARLPAALSALRQGNRAMKAGLDPYVTTVERLSELAATTPMARPGKFLYSNLGFAVLGNALAAAAGVTYSQLVADRIAVPLGLEHTQSIATSDELPVEAPTGRDARGRASAPWTMTAYAPAGNIRSTLPDMMRYIEAQLHNTAPGAEATRPRVAVPRQGSIGFAWFTDRHGLTWHNGMTGGFASFLGFSRTRSEAIVVLSNTAVSVDALALSLLATR